MKLIPEQVQALLNALEVEKEALSSFKDYFSGLKHGDSEAMLNDGSNLFSESQYLLTEKMKTSFADALKRSDRVREIDTTKIELGTKFFLQFLGEEQPELYTLVDTKIGMSNINCISLNTSIGKALQGAVAGDEVVYFSPETKQQMTATVTGIVDDIHQYVKYLPHRDLSEVSYLTDSQVELLELEKNLVTHEMVKEKSEMEELVPGTKVTVCIGDDTREYTVVDKPEYAIDKDSEISIHSDFFQRIENRNIENCFTFYMMEDGVKKRKYGRVQNVNQENVFSYEEKNEKLNTLTTRLEEIDYLLTSVPRVNPEINGEKIDIGSHVSLICNETGESKRVELIQRAVSLELDTNYLEVDSPIGRQIVGLTEESSVLVSQEGAVYTVFAFDIDNSKDASRISDLKFYQKLKK